MKNITQTSIITLLLLGMGIPQANAEEPKKNDVMKSFEELGYSPPFRVAAFKDDPNYKDCNGVDARRGLCLERVLFVDSVPSWSLADRFEALKDFDTNLLRYVYAGVQMDWTDMDSRDKQKVRSLSFIRREQHAKLYAQLW